MNTRVRFVAAAAVVVSAAPGGQARAQEYTELSRDDEARLALSAGPPAVGAHATAYVFGPHGFEKAVDGGNGFACLVVRSARDRSLLAPHCLNPAAVRTVLPAMLREGELQAKGWDAAAIDAELKRLFDTEALPLPAGPAYAYMLSGGQQLGSAGRFKPHFMLYVPYVTNADIGGDPRRQEFPFVGPVEGHPLSTVVIIMDEFVEPSSVTVPIR